MASVLFIVTNATKFQKGNKECGWYLPTVCFAYQAFIDAGYKVHFASVKGGETQVDPESADLWDFTACTDFLYDRPVISLLKNTTCVKDVDPKQYHVVFFAGGYGSMYDLAGDINLKKVVAAVYENGGIVSSVGMGAAGLLNVKLSNGKSLISGKKITGYTDAEMKRSGKADLMPFMLEAKLKAEGAKFQPGSFQQLNVVEDGRLITGQNCTSTAETANKIIASCKPKCKGAESINALFVVTNISTLGDGRAAGWYLPTISYPYTDLKKEGVNITFCSPYGGDAIVDDESVGLWDHPECAAFMRNSVVLDEIKKTVPIKDVDASKYKIIVFGGGFGASYDIATHDTVKKVTAQIYENGGIVSCVANGGAGLLNVKLSDGRYLVQDKHVTSITDEELSRLPEHSSVPFKIQSKLIEQGAIFEEGTPVKENVTVSDCGRIVTGQNPNSSINTALALVKAYKTMKALC